VPERTGKGGESQSWARRLVSLPRGSMSVTTEEGGTGMHKQAGVLSQIQGTQSHESLGSPGLDVKTRS
jgi:hypothetical protein